MNKKYCGNCQKETEFTKEGTCKTCNYQQFINGFNVNLM